MNCRLPLAFLLLALLAACGGGSDSNDDARTASGEVLEGTISDAMIPLDQLRSEAPLMKPEAAKAVDGEGEEGEGDGTAGDTADVQADPAGAAISADLENEGE